MLPPSKANAGQPQVVPGKIWVATLCSILFLVAYAAIIFTQPDRLREAMYVTAEPSVVSLDELAKDKSRDPRNANLRGIRVETMDEKETRDGSLDGVHQVHPIGDLGESTHLTDPPHRASAPRESSISPR